MFIVDHCIVVCFLPVVSLQNGRGKQKQHLLPTPRPPSPALAGLLQQNYLKREFFFNSTEDNSFEFSYTDTAFEMWAWTKVHWDFLTKSRRGTQRKHKKTWHEGIQVHQNTKIWDVEDLWQIVWIMLSCVLSFSCACPCMHMFGVWKAGYLEN